MVGPKTHCYAWRQTKQQDKKLVHIRGIPKTQRVLGSTNIFFHLCLPTAAEIVEKYSGIGICGDRKIPVSEAVSNEYRVPEEVRVMGYEVITLYVDERIRKIEAHNLNVYEMVRNETITLREATRGQGIVRCPDCQEDVAWGHLMAHRTRTCSHLRV